MPRGGLFAPWLLNGRLMKTVFAVPVQKLLSKSDVPRQNPEGLAIRIFHKFGALPLIKKEGFMDLFEALIWAAVIAAGIMDVALPALLIILIVKAAGFFRNSQKEIYENVEDYAKKVKILFTVGILVSVPAVILLFVGYYNNIAAIMNAAVFFSFIFGDGANAALIQLGFFILNIILGILAFGKNSSAAKLYRNLYPPVPTANTYKENAARASAPKPDTDLSASAVASDEEWDRLFGGNGDMSPQTDKADLRAKNGGGDFEKSSKNALSGSSDIRKAPDKELMRFLEGEDAKAKEAVVPAENKKAGDGDGLNLCPECGYLNFEGNTECDFCGAKLKEKRQS